MRLPSPVRGLVLLPLLSLACGGSTASGSSGGDAGLVDGRSPDGALPPADGPFACGTGTCSATQYCVQECTCGGVLACGQPSDAGTCPTGQVLENNCCIQPCSNPPPSCQDTVQCTGFSSTRSVQCPCPG